MKNWILTLFAPALLLTSCLKTTPVDYLPFVVGEWVAISTNSTSATDSIQVFKFNPDFTINYAHGEPTDDGRMIWRESTNYTYTVTDNRIAVSSKPGAPQNISFTLDIGYLAGDVMLCQVSHYKLDGVSVAANDGLKITFERSVVNLRQLLYGVWRTEAEDGQYQWYWEIKPGGRYDFLIYDPVTNRYVSKSIDKSTYKLYGRYFVSIFTDGFTGQPQGESCEVHQINNLTPVLMSWSRLKANGQLIWYTQLREQKLP